MDTGRAGGLSVWGPAVGQPPGREGPADGHRGGGVCQSGDRPGGGGSRRDGRDLPMDTGGGTVSLGTGRGGGGQPPGRERPADGHGGGRGCQGYQQLRW